MEYRLATHYGSGTVRHAIEADRLVVEYEKSGERVEVPYADVAEINLRHDLAGVYSAHVVRRVGKTIVIPARHFKSLGQFDDRGADYVAFIEELHRAVHAAAPATRFVSGSSVLYWLGWAFVFFGVLFTAALGYAFLFMTKRPPLRIFLSTPLTLAVGAMFIRQGRATPYPADALPAKLLPPRPQHRA